MEAYTERMGVAIIYCFGENPNADSTAKSAAEALTRAYPNHSWWVECKGGILLIKHFGISSKLGMLKHLSKMAGSARAFQREVVLAAGELLERAGLARRDYRGESVQHLEVDDPKLRKHFHKQPAQRVIH